MGYCGRGRKPGYSAKRGAAVYKVNRSRCRRPKSVPRDSAFLRWTAEQVRLHKWSLDACVGYARCNELFPQETIPCTKTLYMIIFQYSINRARTGKRKFSDWLKSAKELYADYTETVKQLKERTKEKKALSAEKKATPALKILRHRELTQRVAALTEEIEELRSEKAHLLDSLSCKDDSEISRFKKEVADTEQAVKRLSVQEEKYTEELEKAFTEYNELKSQTENLDPVELFYTRENLRNECEEAAESRIRTDSKNMDFWGSLKIPLGDNWVNKVITRENEIHFFNNQLLYLCHQQAIYYPAIRFF